MNSRSTRQALRCAIYTRKSTDEGLDQGFNSLDAQYEACAAYIASQKHEGWKLVLERYDDGGVSGGTLHRPGLQRLLAEIEAGRIGMIVVYKIDRLTRSLSDFVRLVERLDAKGCSFVSVTQAFNTSSSMGRLTLNVLLSFAQFEREVTAERIRDKIAASKRKGMFMGGTVLLGYRLHPDARERTLVVDETEASTVRLLFGLYEELGCLRALTEAARDRGLVSLQRVLSTGRRVGGTPFRRGQLYYLLRNPVYLGRVRHRGETHEGLHPAMVPKSQWHRVQKRLQQKSGRARDDRRPLAESAPLTGLLRDEIGDRLTPTHTRRHGRRYRNYVSHRLVTGPTDPMGWRLRAEDLEQGIARSVRAHLRQCLAMHRLLAQPDIARTESLRKSLDAAGDTHKDADGLQPWLSLVAEGQVSRDGIALCLQRGRIAGLLALAPDELHPVVAELVIRVRMRRRSTGSSLLTDSLERQPYPRLVRALADTHDTVAALRAGIDFATLAAEAGASESHLRRQMQLAFLAPDLQRAILTGNHPEHLTAGRLTRPELPLGWTEQRRRFASSACGRTGDARLFERPLAAYPSETPRFPVNSL